MDFTSSGYLGYRHGHDELVPWRELTTGRPPLLRESMEAVRLATELARRTGRAAGTLEASTLHAFVDLWAVLAARPVTVLVDRAAYLIGRIALRANQIPVQTTGHFDPRRAAELAEAAPRGHRVVLLVDGLCPGCGRLAPVDELITALGPRRGIVVLDDTQALGIAGTRPSPTAPYGCGGGGTAARLALSTTAPAIVVASAAKAAAAPVAMVAGPARLIAEVRAGGPARAHGSGPSAAALAALHNALTRDDTDGAARRRALAALVRRFRSGCHALGLPAPDGGSWPAQTVPVPTERAAAIQRRMARGGVRTVVVRRRCRPGVGIAFLVTASHTPDQIDRALHALRAAIGTSAARAS